MSEVDVVFYSEECQDARSRVRVHRVPVLDWFDRIPEVAQRGLIARLELLRTRGGRVGAPHSMPVGQRLRAIWCRCEGTKHLILYALRATGEYDDRTTAILLHGVSIDDSPYVTESAPTRRQIYARQFRIRRPTSAALVAPDIDRSAPLAASQWGGVLPERDVALAAERLEILETAPELHILLLEQ